MVSGSAVAVKVAGLMTKGEIAVGPNVASVDTDRCRACGTCEHICKFGAVRVRRTEASHLVAVVDEILCRGCGTCAAHCPSGAITAGNFGGTELESLLRTILVGV